MTTNKFQEELHFFQTIDHFGKCLHMCLSHSFEVIYNTLIRYFIVPPSRTSISFEASLKAWICFSPITLNCGLRIDNLVSAYHQRGFLHLSLITSFFISTVHGERNMTKTYPNITTIESEKTWQFSKYIPESTEHNYFYVFPLGGLCKQVWLDTCSVSWYVKHVYISLVT